MPVGMEICAPVERFPLSSPQTGVVRTNKDWIMSLFRICTGAAIAAGFLVLATLTGAGDYLAPGVYAEEYTPTKKPARRKNRQAEVEQGSTPEEIARYFALHGGNIDPYINKQSPGGPFDSGFFFDSGIGPNGGDSPYMN
ncbi:MAG: hypothetical protein ABI457_00840 [Hyphomicrobium sp.]|jgi:hypothetical protein